MKDVGKTRLGIENDHDGDANLQVLMNLFDNIPPAVARRADLDDEIGRDRQVTLGNRPSGQAIKAVKGYVGSTHRIGISLRDHAGIIAENVAKVVFVGMPPKEVIGFAADLTVTRSRWGHRDNPSLNELFRITGIGLSTKFLGGEKGRGRRSPYWCLHEIPGIRRFHFRGIDTGRSMARCWRRYGSGTRARASPAPRAGVHARGGLRRARRRGCARCRGGTGRGRVAFLGLFLVSNWTVKSRNSVILTRFRTRPSYSWC